MLPIDLDVTRGIRCYMMTCVADGTLSPERIRSGLHDAIWYSPNDRRAVRALFDRNPRTFTRWLFETERNGRYTGLIMIWPPGHRTAIHDHAGLWGIEYVLQGTLDIEDYEVAIGDDDDAVQPRFVGGSTLREGDSCAFEGVQGHAHRCSNPSSRLATVTLHLYGGLLDRYRAFEPLEESASFKAIPVHARIDGQFGPRRDHS